MGCLTGSTSPCLWGKEASPYLFCCLYIFNFIVNLVLNVCAMALCKICGKVFQNRKALQQHRVTHFSKPRRGRSAAVGNSTGGPPPRRPKVPRPPAQNKAVRSISGRDLVALVVMKTTNNIGDVLYQTPINPASFAETRLAQEASLFSRWRPSKLRFDIQSSAGSLIMGAYAGGWTSDSSVSFGKGEATLKQVAALVPYQSGHVGKALRIDIPTNLVQKDLYVSSKEPDDSVQGRFVLVVVAPLAAVTTSSAITISVYLNWTVHFYGPKLPAQAENAGIYADSDYAGYHTTSTNDWAEGKKLSLKQHAGGSLVPFPEARPQTVYKLDPDAKLTYKKNPSGEGEVKFGVLIPNFSVKAFAVFESATLANKFALTGDSTHCLDYFAAGDVVQPDNPVWYEQSSLSSLLDQDSVKLAQALDKVRILEDRLRALTEKDDDLSEASSFLEVKPLGL